MPAKNRPLQAVMMILISMVLTSCYAGNGTEYSDAAPSAEAVSLSFVYSGGDPDRSQVMQEIADAFNADHPDIRIQAIPSSAGVSSYEDYLQNLNAVGEFPDFLELKDPEPYIKAGFIAPMPDEIIDLLDHPARFNGSVYTAQLASSLPYAIYYNKDVFQQAGIAEEPATWSEFLDICARIKAAGISPIVVGGREVWHLGYWSNFFFGTSMYADNPNWNRDAAAKQVQFADAGIVRALSDMEELWVKKYVNPGWLYTTDSDSATELANGRAGMLYTGPEALKTIYRINPDANIGIFAPPDRKGRIVINGSERLQGFALTSEAGKDPRKRSAFIAFMKLFYSPEPYKRYIQAGHALSVTKDNMEYEAVNPLVEELIAISQNPHAVKVQLMQQYWASNAAPEGFLDWFLGMMQYTLATGRPTVEQLLQQADEQWAKRNYKD
ncbi:extracellular solute-binding protein [Paenibacillus oenotherae]|uniref:Extracellular solute-binding protein n=1 Tax=Paenibacillus oenotherae TaxID=1435645 RepID=A0ABS7D8P6_9BACL|nr:extracellular solute-binding protein [Paenibacillus oenotherae]MBW7476314.1 extracellular solute-binding protein [Paenibacillus oenotherae]